MALALIIAKKHRAGFEPAPGRAAVARQAVQEPQAFSIEPAEGLLLQAASNHSSQQVLAQTRRWPSSEHHPPAAPKGITRKCRDAADLALDRRRAYPLPPHGYARGWPPLSAG